MHTYRRIVQKPYCCVAACTEMILKNEHIISPEQEDIAYELGLIVPEEDLPLVKKARTGKRPRPGWGTQIHEKEYSLGIFFTKHKHPLQEIVIRYQDIESTENLKRTITKSLNEGEHILCCFNYPKLYGLKGSWGHASH